MDDEFDPTNYDDADFLRSVVSASKEVKADHNRVELCVAAAKSLLTTQQQQHNPLSPNHFRKAVLALALANGANHDELEQSQTQQIEQEDEEDQDESEDDSDNSSSELPSPESPQSSTPPGVTQCKLTPDCASLLRELHASSSTPLPAFSSSSEMTSLSASPMRTFSSSVISSSSLFANSSCTISPLSVAQLSRTSASPSDLASSSCPHLSADLFSSELALLQLQTKIAESAGLLLSSDDNDSSKSSSSVPFDAETHSIACDLISQLLLDKLRLLEHLRLQQEWIELHSMDSLPLVPTLAFSRMCA